MTWIIQDKIFGDETNKLIEALKNNNIKYKILQECPDIKCPTFDSSKMFIRGSIDFVEFFRKVCNRNFHLTLDNYTYSFYSKYYSVRMLNSDFIILPWWALKSHRMTISNSFPDIEKFFIRPNSGRKIFTGTTLTRRWWDKELDIISRLPNSHIRLDDLIIISPYKEILAEYRLLMYKDQLIDWSLYSGEPDHLFDPLIVKFFATSVDFFPNDLYTMDLAKTEDSYKIVEINSLCSAGWYNVDYKKVIKFIKDKV